DHE
ncbi:hypothetical protein VCHC71A1_00224B, partial [Vibrio cholerae HC-71A1]